jgi:hypothetical protein
MDDARLVAGVERPGQPLAEGQGVLEVQAAPLAEELVQVVAVDPGQGHEGHAAMAPHGLDAHDAAPGAAREELGLALQPEEERRLGQGRPDDLEGHGHPAALVLRPVDGPHAARPGEVLDAVAAVDELAGREGLGGRHAGASRHTTVARPTWRYRRPARSDEPLTVQRGCWAHTHAGPPRPPRRGPAPRAQATRRAPSSWTT